ncbi:trypsin-like serine peptidase [Nocardiopsis suaedae]|uniref:Trypsin-like serine protease n=1 Tax=Nocardiopsis suaedae TaxID=3018444 RepID=A0ABT4TK36_9ACTN|nr:trypsin-like serine protease [Nocardiopsis suaedae]MDA2805068.1 trypsin-like serine protease [Nocardiopsis suaedae]
MGAPLRSMFLVAVAAALVASAAPTAAAQEAAPEAAAVASENVAVQGDISAHWTEERMRAAEPMAPPERSSAQKRPTPPPEDVLPALTGEGAPPADGARPAPDGIAPLQGSTAQRWGNQGSMPALTMGQLYFDDENGDPARCSGSVINTDNRNTVWTAGHCLHAGGTGGDGWHSAFMFVPDADNGREPHGRWEWRRAVTVKGWTEDRDHEYDLGAVRFNPQPQRGDMQDVTGAQGYRFNYGQEFDNVHHFGFPANGYERDDFTGEDLWYCTGPTEDAGWFTEELVHQCDMAQGASGGPWLDDLQTGRGWGYIVGLNSNSEKDADGDPVDLDVYSPNHGDAAINVYNDIS